MFVTQSRNPPDKLLVVVEQLDQDTGVWEDVAEMEGSYEDGKAWYLANGDDEQAYRVKKVYPPHRVYVEGDTRRLGGMEG